MMETQQIQGLHRLEPSQQAVLLVSLSPSVTSALRALARQQELTPRTILRGAWAILLSRYLGAVEVGFGVAEEGRSEAPDDSGQMVGLFTDVLPLAVRVEPHRPLAAWLGELEAMRAQQPAPPEVFKRGDTLFESLLLFERALLSSSLQAQARSLEGELKAFEHTSYPLTVVCYDEPAWRLKFDYDERRFDRATVRRMAEHLERLVTSIGEPPEARISELEMLGSEELYLTLVEWNRTEAEYEREATIAELFARQAARTPEAEAVVAGEERLTYGELEERAEWLARRRRERGVVREERVGLLMGRGVRQVVRLLGVLKAGGAYVPLDPEYPAERLSYMVEDAGVRVLVTQRGLGQGVEAPGAQVIYVEDEAVEDGADSVVRAEASGERASADNLAYVIYTSGSTGRPKGMAVTHTEGVR